MRGLATASNCISRELLKRKKGCGFPHTEVKGKKTIRYEESLLIYLASVALEVKAGDHWSQHSESRRIWRSLDAVDGLTVKKSSELSICAATISDGSPSVPTFPRRCLDRNR